MKKRIASAQYTPAMGDIASNLEIIQKLASESVEAGADHVGAKKNVMNASSPFSWEGGFFNEPDALKNATPHKLIGVEASAKRKYLSTKNPIKKKITPDNMETMIVSEFLLKNPGRSLL